MSTRPLRLILLAGLGIAVVGIALVVVGASALSPARLADALKDSVYRSTGRELTIAGGVHLKIGLAPQIEVDDVSLANIQGGSRPQMLTAKSLVAHLALLPLLGGDAVISSLSLQDADIVLERSTDGTGNWQFSPAHRPLYRAHAGASHGGGGGRVEVRSVLLQGGQVTWLPGTGPGVTLGIDHLRWTADSVDAPMTLAFTGKGDAPVTLTANSGSLQRLQGGAVSALAGTWPLTVDLAALGATLHVEGGLNHPDQGRGYQFRVTANAPALDTLAPLVPGTKLPPLADVNATLLLSDGPQGELRTSQVSVHAGPSDLARYVPGLAVSQLVFNAPGPGQLVQLVLDGTYQGQKMSLAGTATQPDVVGSTGPIQATLTGQAAGATFNAHGTVPPSLTAAGLDLTVAMRAADLSSLSPLVGRALPPAHDFSLDAHVGDAGVKLRGVAVRDLAIGSSLGDLTGQLTVDWAPRASVTGTLTSHMLDLDAIGAPSGGLLPAIWPLPDAGGAGQSVAMPAPSQPASSQSASSQSASSEPASSQLGTVTTMPEPSLPLAQLRRADADLTLSIDALTAGGQKLTDLQAHLQLHDGKLALNPFRAQTEEGAIVGGASLDASSDEPSVAVTLRSPSIAAGAMADLLGYPDGAHGTMQVDAQLSGTGQTAQAIKATLDGHLGLAMVAGQVEDSLIQGLLGAALDSAGVPSFGGGTSQVRCLALRADFSNGTGTVRALALDTSKLTLDGTGQVDLRDRTADLHLRPRLRLGPTEVAAPVWLHGPFDALKGTLDPVLGGGRVGMFIGGAPAGPSGCASRLALARGGLGGPLPPVAAAVDQGFSIRKPRDLLKGLFH